MTVKCLSPAKLNGEHVSQVKNVANLGAKNLVQNGQKVYHMPPFLNVSAPHVNPNLHPTASPHLYASPLVNLHPDASLNVG